MLSSIRSTMPALLSSLLLASSCSTALDEKFEPAAVDSTLTRNAAAVTAIKRFSFGSCSKQYLPQPLWKNILEDKPDLFLWTGDVVYADTRDMAKLSQIYASELKQPEYANFLASGIPVIAVWDDHDYGENDAGKDYPPKKESQKLFLDFIGEAEDSPRRQEDGVYASYVFGEGKDALRFILLDTRSNKTKGKDGDILGDAQWRWLEEELSRNVAAVTFIVSSIQVLPFEQKFEKWGNTPASRSRLIKMMDNSPSPNIVIISGDRHFAELSQWKAPSGKAIWEITASGMTHSFQNPDEARNKNSLRVGPILDRLNYGLIDFDAAQKTLRIQARDLNRTSVIDQTILLGR